MCWWVGGAGKVLEAGACGLDGNGGTGDVSGKYNYGCGLLAGICHAWEWDNGYDVRVDHSGGNFGLCPHV